MSRFAIVLGLSAIVLGQSVFAAPIVESTDEVEKMQAMFKNIESIFGEPKQANDDVKAYERVLRESLENSLAMARAYNFSSSDLASIVAMAKILEQHPMRQIDDEIEFAVEVSDEFVTED